MFSPQQIEQFQRDGFFTVPHFFNSEEVKVIQAEIERFLEVGLLHNVSTEGDGKTHSTTKRNLQLCPTNPHSPRFRALPFVDKVVTSVTQLVGDPIKLNLDQVFLKPARDGAGTSWHQDNGYFCVADPMKGVAMWIAVHDATVANGTMHMIPGMQHKLLEHSRDPLSDHHVRCYPDESKEVACELQAGGVVFFAYGTPHCTKGNGTDRDRAGLAFHFFNAHFPPNGGSGFENMPWLSGDLADGGKSQYGEDQRGKWSAFVGSS